jgi:isochorismate synthase
MDVIASNSTLRRDLPDPGQSTFLFSSPHRAIRAFGVGERIALPACGGEDRAGPLQDAVGRALAAARRAGQPSPVVVGAIPFDTREPSCLFVPHRHRMLDRDEVAAGIGESRREEHRVLGTRSLPGKDGFTQAVSGALAAFAEGGIRKAVLSRVLEIELTRPVDVAAVMATLIRQNPSGYHFQVPLPDGGVLLGASPELLVRKQGDAVVSNPLAGSAKRSDDPGRDILASRQLLQSSKDNHEHALVIEGVRRLLEPWCRTLTVPAEPMLMHTPTMWHLSTLIEGEAREKTVSALQLACLLHPTAAVCGVPTAGARALIQSLEPFDRGLFAGIVGWCDADGDGEWAIVIRCGTVNDRWVRLFAGAGIVPASDPASEWAETGAKLRTMLRAFGIGDEGDGR